MGSTSGIPLLSASLIGGLAGAYLLLKTPAHTFMRVLPWLTLGATLLFAFGKKLAGGRASVIEHEPTGLALAGATLFQLAGAVYGGYFGGGMGIVMLAMLAAYSPAPGLPVTTYRTLMVLAGVGAVLTTAYFVQALRRINQAVPEHPPVTDVESDEWVAWAPLVAMTLVLGLAPGLLLWSGGGG